MKRNSDHQAAVVDAEKALAEAHLSLDLETIDRLLHPDYMIVQPDGRVETKAEVLASYQTGMRHWDTASVGELTVTLHGETAVVVGRWQATGKNNSERFNYAARFLSVWIRDEGRWRNIAYQSVEIKK
jgi:ketosteroid isomerase-like protein